jgi:cbb3-type cytochrome oxidase subunit 3
MAAGMQAAVAVILTLTLVGVLWYAWEARKQAKASMQIARETRLSRQDELRPVLNIQKAAPEEFGTGRVAMARHLAQATGDDHIWCTLENVGAGPAVNIRGRFLQRDRAQSESALGTLGVRGTSVPWPLVVENGFVQVLYEDVYGRQFLSCRPVTFSPEGPDLGALEAREA